MTFRQSIFLLLSVGMMELSVGVIGRISRNESSLGTLGLPADFAASAATNLRWRIYGVNMVRNPSPAISSVPEPLFPRWSKRVPP
jgi:hypothetical protein